MFPASAICAKESDLSLNGERPETPFALLSAFASEIEIARVIEGGPGVRLASGAKTAAVKRSLWRSNNRFAQNLVHPAHSSQPVCHSGAVGKPVEDTHVTPCDALKDFDRCAR